MNTPENRKHIPIRIIGTTVPKQRARSHVLPAAGLLILTSLGAAAVMPASQPSRLSYHYQDGSSAQPVDKPKQITYPQEIITPTVVVSASLVPEPTQQRKQESVPTPTAVINQDRIRFSDEFESFLAQPIIIQWGERLRQLGKHITLFEYKNPVDGVVIENQGAALRSAPILEPRYYNNTKWLDFREIISWKRMIGISGTPFVEDEVFTRTPSFNIFITRFDQIWVQAQRKDSTVPVGFAAMLNPDTKELMIQQFLFNIPPKPEIAEWVPAA